MTGSPCTIVTNAQVLFFFPSLNHALHAGQLQVHQNGIVSGPLNLFLKQFSRFSKRNLLK